MQFQYFPRWTNYLTERKLYREAYTLSNVNPTLLRLKRMPKRSLADVIVFRNPLSFSYI